MVYVVKILNMKRNVKVEVILREEQLSGIIEEISRTMFANFAFKYFM